MTPLRKLTIPTSLTACFALLTAACDKEEETQLCPERGDMRACDDGEGTQFCDGGYDQEQDPVWGQCLRDFECMPGEQRSCGFDPEEFGGDIQQSCVLVDGVPQWDENACITPLVLSFEGGPIEMRTSSAAFDISGAEACFDTDWPAAQNPWLAIDLDKNGHIDGGHELFGSGSILSSGRHAQNGFVALEQLDSDHDGRITAADDRFDELLVWRDVDGDKRSLGHELTPLRDEGVQAIELGFTVAEQCDARGNCARERSRFEFVAGDSGQVRVGEVVDVYLACQ